jgi:hypothetical protein
MSDPNSQPFQIGSRSAAAARAAAARSAPSTMTPAAMRRAGSAGAAARSASDSDNDSTSGVSRSPRGREALRSNVHATPKGSHVAIGSTARSTKEFADTVFGPIQVSTKKASLKWSIFRAICNTFKDWNIQTEMTVRPLEGLLSDLADGKKIKTKTPRDAAAALEKKFGEQTQTIFDTLAATIEQKGGQIISTNAKNGISTAILPGLKFHPANVAGEQYSYDGSLFATPGEAVYEFLASHYSTGRQLSRLPKAVASNESLFPALLDTNTPSAKVNLFNTYLNSLFNRSSIPHGAALAFLTATATRKFTRKDFNNGTYPEAKFRGNLFTINGRNYILAELNKLLPEDSAAPLSPQDIGEWMFYAKVRKSEKAAKRV